MSKSSQHKIDKGNHEEKPLLNQLGRLGWEIIDLTDESQLPSHIPGEFNRGGDVGAIKLFRNGNSSG